MFATRVYAIVFVLSLATVVAVEAFPREMGGLSNTALAVRRAKFERTLGLTAGRVGRGDVELGDEMQLASVRAEVAALESETRVRSLRTIAFVVLALSSVVFALVAAPGVLFRKRTAPRAGTVEVEPEETLDIDPSDAAYEVGRLHTSRKAALAHLLSQVSLHCASCRWLWQPKILGRVGHRILTRRMPPGSPVKGDVLGEGWWSRPAEPSACTKCGGKELLPD